MSREITMATQCLTRLLVLVTISVLMAVPASSEILTEEPDWHQGQQSNALLDPDTGRPFVLTAQERAVCVKAMEALNDHTRLLYGHTVEHLQRGEQINLGDVIFLNGPLMAVQQPQYQMTDEEIAIIKPLLERLRAAATKMVGTTQ